MPRFDSNAARLRLCNYALAILDAAQTEAAAAPIALTPAIRLAIGWLVRDGVADLWQAKLWAAALTQLGHGGMADYCRTRDLAICLNAWRRVINDREAR